MGHYIFSRKFIAGKEKLPSPAEYTKLLAEATAELMKNEIDLDITAFELVFCRAFVDEHRKASNSISDKRVPKTTIIIPAGKEKIESIDSRI